MCGIVGTTEPELCAPETFDRMLDALAHRGPDGRGVFRDERVVLGNRRLAVLDPTPRGAQPMASESGDVVLIHNGEIYNHRELRALVPDRAWRSDTDTETILALYEKEGIDCLSRLNGMFALTIYDKKQDRLFLARDRVGIKPLFYAFDGEVFLFASELRALRLHPSFDARMDFDALHDYFLFNYVPCPRTIHRGARRVAPGQYAEFDLSKRRVKLRTWWNPREIINPGDAAKKTAASPPKKFEKAVDQLEELIQDAVKLCTLSDVPLGCFLSGGVDSTAVAAALAKSTDHARTFCVGFEQSTYDESVWAKRVARKLGTEHETLPLSARDGLALAKKIGATLDEPFADASFLPTLMLCRAARPKVTVALSGDGGDELFLGYERYLWLDRVLRWADRVPSATRRLGATALARLPFYKPSMIGRALQWDEKREAYPWLFIGWNERFASRLMRRREAFEKNSLHAIYAEAGSVHPVRAAAWTDLRHYMVDDLLTKVDRASMAASLEVRVPLLDHRIVEFALGLPASITWGPREPKRLLKAVAARHVPRKWVDRPKRGFAVPMRSWLRGPLRPLLEEALSPAELRKHDLFDARVVRKTMQRHFSGRWNHERQLWALLVFQLWLAENWK